MEYNILATHQKRRGRYAIVGLVLAAAAIITAASQLVPSPALTTVAFTADATASAAGKIPEGQEPSVFDVDVPAVQNLDPRLRAALQDAANDAVDDGVAFQVNSGWRSAQYQQELLREAIAEYGSKEEAARWVATPESSPHVSGDAADLGPTAATSWLSQHGAAYGLCQIYANEPWHFELRPSAVTAGCPQMFADPTQDLRMRP